MSSSVNLRNGKEYSSGDLVPQTSYLALESDGRRTEVGNISRARFSDSVRVAPVVHFDVVSVHSRVGGEGAVNTMLVLARIVAV